MRVISFFTLITLLISIISVGQVQINPVIQSSPTFPDSMEVELLVENIDFGEGPLWHPDGFLLYTAIDGNQVLKYDPDTDSIEVFYNQSGGANGLSFDPQGRLIMCRQNARDLVRLEPNGSLSILASRYDGKILNSPNDLAVRSDGTIFFTDLFTSLGQQKLDFQGVFAYTPMGQLKLLDNSLEGPNGITLSPDESKLYVSDVGTVSIYVYDIDDNNNLSNKTAFAEIADANYLDGMKVDENGFLYVTAGGLGLWIFTPEGDLYDILDLDGQLTTNLNWGDKDYQTLYITTYTSLYRVLLNVTGVVTPTLNSVYPINTSLSSNFQGSGIDQMIIQTELINPESYNLTAHAIITGLDWDFTDSLKLFDDGLHFDQLADDKIFGNIYTRTPVEGFYNVSIKTTLSEPSRSYCSFESHFTTAGPIKLDHINYTPLDSVPDPGDEITIKPVLISHGSFLTTERVSCNLYCLDTFWASVPDSDFYFGSIEPGEMVESITKKRKIHIQEDCPDSTLLNFRMEIAVDDFIYWHDTFQIKVGRGFISGVDDLGSKKQEGIMIFPNPTSNLINITGLIQPADVKLYSIQGQIAKSFQQVQTSIDVSDLPTGLYIVSLKTADNEIIRKRIVKQ